MAKIHASLYRYTRNRHNQQHPSLKLDNFSNDYIEWNLHGIADNKITSNLKSKHTIPVNDIISTSNSPQLVATNHQP